MHAQRVHSCIPAPPARPAPPACLPCLPAGLIDPVVFELYGGDRNTPAVRCLLPLQALAPASSRCMPRGSRLLLKSELLGCTALHCTALLQNKEYGDWSSMMGTGLDSPRCYNLVQQEGLGCEQSAGCPAGASVQLMPPPVYGSWANSNTAIACAAWQVAGD